MAYKLSSLTKNIHPRYADHTVNPEMLVPMERIDQARIDYLNKLNYLEKLGIRIGKDHKAPHSKTFRSCGQRPGRPAVCGSGKSSFSALP